MSTSKDIIKHSRTLCFLLNYPQTFSEGWYRQRGIRRYFSSNDAHFLYSSLFWAHLTRSFTLSSITILCGYQRKIYSVKFTSAISKIFGNITFNLGESGALTLLFLEKIVCEMIDVIEYEVNVKPLAVVIQFKFQISCRL